MAVSTDSERRWVFITIILGRYIPYSCVNNISDRVTLRLPYKDQQAKVVNQKMHKRKTP